MKKILVACAITLSFVAVAMAVMIFHDKPEWTTTSPAALAEFQRGLDDEMKIYIGDARDHFQRAVELDPAFIAAKLKLFGYSEKKDKQSVAKLRKELDSIDMKQLTDRERFLVKIARARLDDKQSEAAEILNSYLSENPKDPYALVIRCGGAWDRQDWHAAETCYSSLIATSPNWVLAQNHLGYIAMAQGRFKEAEDLFRTYRFIAPDQANPHDSLGELFILLGRYEEAEAELNEALRIRPDFCASYEHLIQSAILQTNIPKIEAVIDRAARAKACDDDFMNAERCSLSVWKAITERRFGDAITAFQAPGCSGLDGESLVVAHRSALLAGRRDVAVQIENQIRQELKRRPNAKAGAIDRAVLSHLEGSRMMAEGSYARAVERLQAADRQFVYWGNGQGIFKLYNRLLLAEALKRTGDGRGAATMLQAVRAVNPSFDAGALIRRSPPPSEEAGR